MAVRARLAVLPTRPETVLADYQHLVELLDIPVSPSVARTVLVPHRSGPLPLPGTCTPPWQLEGAVLALRAWSAPGLVYARLEPADAREDWLAHRSLLDAYGLSAIPWSAGGEPYVPRQPLPVLRACAPHGICLPAGLRETLLVELAALAPPNPAGMLAALRMVAGGLPGLAVPTAPGRQAALLADLYALLREAAGGYLVLGDGTSVWRGGRSEVRNLLLASTDRAAVMAGAAQLFGTPPAITRQTGLQGLADDRVPFDRDTIELVGDQALLAECWAPAPRQRRAWLPGLVAERRDRQALQSWLDGTRWGALYRAYRRPARPR